MPHNESTPPVPPPEIPDAVRAYIAEARLDVRGATSYPGKPMTRAEAIVYLADALAQVTKERDDARSEVTHLLPELDATRSQLTQVGRQLAAIHPVLSAALAWRDGTADQLVLFDAIEAYRATLTPHAPAPSEENTP